MTPVQPPRDLLWTPIQSQLRLDQLPGFRQDALAAVIATAKRSVMRLLRSVASQTFIPTQFSTDGRFVCTNHGCYLGPVMSHSQQGIYLVSLFLGKLCVGHKHSFDLVVLRGLSYTSLPLSTIKVALVT
jgi:hypothetical protein